MKGQWVLVPRIRSQDREMHLEFYFHSNLKEKIHFVSKCSSPSIKHILSPDSASSVLGHCTRSAVRPDCLGLYLSPTLYPWPLVSYLSSLALFPHLLNRVHNSTPQGVVRMNKLIHLEHLDSEGQ